MQSQERNFSQEHKTPCNNQHTEKACFAWGMQQTDFPAFYCYQKSTNLPSRRVAEKLGRDIRRPCEYVYQCVRNHKSRISRKSTKRPAINQHGRESLFHMGMQQTDFPAFYCYQKSTNFPSRRVAEKLGMTLQEIYADPVNTFTSVYAITRAEFFANTQNAIR